MYFKHIIFSFIFIGIFFGSYAQEESSGVSDVDILDKKNENLNLISSGTISNQTSSKRNARSANSGNSVFIRQIGEGNTINSNVNSSNTDIELTQNGDNNTITENIRAMSVEERVNQTGNDNNITRYIDDASSKANLQITQDGGAGFEQYGVNSRTDDIKVTQKSSSRTVIVRSFK
ncbi:hypothetical protein [Mesonia aquimarina]|uniref:hypothetical protein n=1 Tax=Mesonia aquimarina TaxID=1504967 RepID=UPI000EF5BCAF|nr:hypothetical protein [Mesonia aquimarina]